MTFGKVMGGGFPAAAFGGRADVMSRLAPEGPVYQAGTLSGNPIATTAGLATLRLATDEVYAHLTAAGDTIKAAAAEALTDGRRRRTSCSPTGTMFSVFFTDGRRSATSRTPPARTATAYAAFFHAMLDRGVYLPPSAYEAWFLSSAHDDRAVQTVLDALPDAAARGGRAAREGDPMSQTPDTIVHLLRHGEVHNPEGVLYGRRDGFHLSDLGRADGAAGRGRRSATATSSHLRRLAARAGAGDRAAAGGGPRPRDRHRPAGDRVDQRVRGQALRPRRRRAAQALAPGGTCGTRSGRRGASPTRRSPPG